jgi:serine/threonine-protein kinase SRPK3
LRIGKLRRVDQLFLLSLEQVMINCGLPEAEVAPAAEFIRACLHLDLNDRSSAAHLAAHPWLKKAVRVSRN